jgi:hypothetical protein
MGSFCNFHAPDAPAAPGAIAINCIVARRVGVEERTRLDVHESEEEFVDRSV